MKSPTRKLLDAANRAAMKHTDRAVLVSFVAGALFALALVWLGTKLGVLA